MKAALKLLTLLIFSCSAFATSDSLESIELKALIDQSMKEPVSAQQRISDSLMLDPEIRDKVLQASVKSFVDTLCYDKEINERFIWADTHLQAYHGWLHTDEIKDSLVGLVAPHRSSSDNFPLSETDADRYWAGKVFSREKEQMIFSDHFVREVYRCVRTPENLILFFDDLEKAMDLGYGSGSVGGAVTALWGVTKAFQMVLKGAAFTYTGSTGKMLPQLIKSKKIRKYSGWAGNSLLWGITGILAYDAAVDLIDVVESSHDYRDRANIAVDKIFAIYSKHLALLQDPKNRQNDTELKAREKDLAFLMSSKPILVNKLLAILKQNKQTVYKKNLHESYPSLIGRLDAARILLTKMKYENNYIHEE
ncbi:MAG: hypothetical protein AB8E15_05280 [Bdellovibrionales bacterium]